MPGEPVAAAEAGDSGTADDVMMAFRVPDAEHALAAVRLPTVVPDPGNPRQAGGAFGPKSVQEFRGYSPPRWLFAPASPGRHAAIEVATQVGAFDALFLQSGSFFVPRLDSQERRFPYYRRITRVTAAMRAGELADRPVPAILTCGAIEENIENNRLMLGVLQARGYTASLHEVRYMHNYTAWRDAFDPGPTELLRQVAG